MDKFTSDREKSSSVYRKFLRRLSVSTGTPSSVGPPNRRSTMSSADNSNQKQLTPEFWRHKQPMDMTSPLSIKRNLKYDTRRTSHPAPAQELLNSDNIIFAADDDDLVSSDSGNDVLDTSHVNRVFTSELERHGDYFVSAFGKRGKEINEYQDAKHITCLPDGRLLVTDYINSRLQMCPNQKGAVTVFPSDVTSQPWASAVTKDNNIAVTVCKDRCVKIFNQNGNLINIFGEGYFIRPTGIAVDKIGNIIVCDSSNNEVCMFDCDRKFIRYLGKSTNGEECFSQPCYVCVSVTEDIIVSDGGHHMIKIFDSKGNFTRSIGSFGKKDGQFKCPYGVCTNMYGDILVADHYNNRISMYTRGGVFIRHLVTSDQGLVHPQGLAISADNYLYVTHGHLKASEILVFKLDCKLDYNTSNGATCISYV